MKKIDLGQTVSILANIGVIAGIIFLAVEIRQNTSAVRSQASQGIQDQLAQLYSIITTTPAMAEVYIDGMADPEQLDRVEQAQLNAFLSLVLGGFENMFAQMREGSYDEARAQGYWQLLRNLLQYPGMRQHWDERGYVHSEDFRAYVEGEVMALEPSSGSTILEPSE